MTKTNKIGLGDAVTVVGKVGILVKEILTPVCVKNRGLWKNLNVIEVCNPSPNLVKNVVVRINGVPADECWWEHPNNSDEQALVIPYIEPNSHVAHELMFSHFESADVMCCITWDDWLGIRHSDTQSLRLEGLC